VAEKKKKQPLIVTVSGDPPIREVAADLKKAGFSVKEVLEIVGSITGSAYPGIVKRLREISGVAHVGEDHPVGI
jgi:hypothetical protein